MSSDFDFNVASWFLGNVRVKIYFNTELAGGSLPPSGSDSPFWSLCCWCVLRFQIEKVSITAFIEFTLIYQMVVIILYVWFFWNELEILRNILSIFLENQVESAVFLGASLSNSHLSAGMEQSYLNLQICSIMYFFKVPFQPTCLSVFC